MTTTQSNTMAVATDYVKTVGIVNNGFNGRGFANPYDIAFQPDGRIYVINRCDPGRAGAIRVGVCNLDEDYLFEFGKGYGQGDGQFVWPVAMAFGTDDRLYITDEHNHRVTVYDSSGEFVTCWGEKGSNPGQFKGPSGIAVDRDGSIVIADQENGRVQRFTAAGDFIAAWGEPGDGDGQLDLPWGVGLGPDGSVFVADWHNDRIQKFSPDGSYLKTIGSPGSGEGQLKRPSGVAVDSSGNIYVADWGNERVQIFDEDGNSVSILRGQATVSKWGMDYFSSNPEEWEVRQASELQSDLPEHLNTPYLTSSQTEPYFWGPVAVRFDDQDRLYVVETNRHRFQVYAKG